MRKPQPFLGETTDRKNALALAGIKALNLTITQDIYNHYPSPHGPRTRK
jgi:hypothetical protein